MGQEADAFREGGGFLPLPAANQLLSNNNTLFLINTLEGSSIRTVCCLLVWVQEILEPHWILDSCDVFKFPHHCDALGLKNKLPPTRRSDSQVPPTDDKGNERNLSGHVTRICSVTLVCVCVCVNHVNYNLSDFDLDL